MNTSASMAEETSVSVLHRMATVPFPSLSSCPAPRRSAVVEATCSAFSLSRLVFSLRQ